MIDLFKQLFSSEPEADINELVNKGATIIDVRTRNEYQGGHLRDSINIPLQELRNKLGQISKAQPVILCCASGSRSRSAQKILQANGYTDVYNGGGWAQLQRKIS